MARSISEARDGVRELLSRSGLSMRALSRAMGRDADYVAAFLDPRRATRARPTPDDLLAASSATGVPFVELLEAVWGIPRDQLARELGGTENSDALRGLSATDRAQVLDFAAFLAQRRRSADTER